ncbi:poly [ADP-ribose] polymerase 2-like isoform X1 [Tripterygium wilfordii]|uniref:poly [ADP-ribose] polymerase 2-like isoform X1 n=1 Tax=Tripterygium wilfordii TaxID=458696 RepID=UPI0018F85E33|nr:poly [ADP-ribose] polymerase 2-like isoform X1 [Tripterygium wilfordii]
MTNKLRVEELRCQLSKRGLSAAGTKPILVQRLESALQEESKPLKDENDDSTGKKKQGDSKMDDPNRRQKIKAVEDLRDSAAPLGFSSSRLWAVPEKGLKDEFEDKEETEENDTSENTLVSNEDKGTAALDQYLPAHIKAEYHVLKHRGDIYDATLNQTNIGDNSNKFYAIQALESNDGTKFMIYNRWGRVGIKGQDKFQGSYISRDDAIREFKSKFFAKTRNQWSKRKEFVGHPKCYTWLEMDYDVDKGLEHQKEPNSIMEIQLQSTKLDPRIADFISLISNIGMMEQQIMGLGYNAKRLPLGKLSKSTIMKGYDVLRRIADFIDQPDKGKLEQLSGEFYTIIPHDFGFRKMSEFIIDNSYTLKSKLEMLEALGQIEVAASSFKDSIYKQEDTLYSHYQSLRCELIPLEVGSEEFLMIERYIHNTGRDLRYNIEIVQMFRVSREGENEKFKKFNNTNNRMLLWHGSRLTNWTGILSKGLLIAPPGAPVSSHRFGKGVYFADMFSKSCRYAFNLSPESVLVLSEVALGDMNELLTYDCYADKLPKGKLSTKGVGRIEPDPSETLILEDGVVVPLGKAVETTEPKGGCWRNEYIVYNVDQIRMRYLVRIKRS